MSDAGTLTDDEFVSAFLDCRLPGASFNHRGHLRIAWLLLNRHPRNQAIELICNGIDRFATHLGAPDKYNRTLSEAVVRLMAGPATAARSWDSFLATNPILVANIRGLLAQYYSNERLFSAEAKRSFLTPDRQPLP
jgi:hypothetical protein